MEGGEIFFAVVLVGLADEGTEEDFGHFPGLGGGDDVALGLGSFAEAGELVEHDALAGVAIALGRGEGFAGFEPGDLLDGAEGGLEPLDAGGELAGGGGILDFGLGILDWGSRPIGGSIALLGLQDGGGFDGALLLVEMAEGFAGDGVEALDFQPAAEAFLLGFAEFALGGGVAFAAPGGDAADDLGDAALGEVKISRELELGFAGDGVGDVDFLIAGGGGWAFAGAASWFGGCHGSFVLCLWLGVEGRRAEY